MARVNVGVNPLYLADQHLIAESVEITMITGGLRKNNYIIKSEIPLQLSLGKGHINFFKDKLLYLNKRLLEVNYEMIRRDFKPGTNLVDILNDAPTELINDWQPTIIDSNILRQRIISRLILRKNGKDGQDYYRYKRETIENIINFSNNLLNSKLFYV